MGYGLLGVNPLAIGLVVSVPLMISISSTSTTRFLGARSLIFYMDCSSNLFILGRYHLIVDAFYGSIVLPAFSRLMSRLHNAARTNRVHPSPTRVGEDVLTAVIELRGVGRWEILTQ